MNLSRYRGNNWTLKKHSLNIELWRPLLEIFKVPQPAIEKSWLGILKTLRDEGLYRPRNRYASISTLGNKLSDMGFFLMVYKAGDRHVLSEYGKLFLFYDNGSEEESKILASALLETPLPNPSSSRNDCNVYPIRLVFWLMLQPELNFYLSEDEIVLLLFWEEEVNDLDSIILSIKRFRQKSKADKLRIIAGLDLGSDINRNKYGWEQATRTRLADITHQASYLKKALLGARLVTIKNGEILDEFIHGNPRARQLTKRKLYTHEWRLNCKIIPFIQEAFQYIDPCDKPIEDYSDLLNGYCYDLYNVLPQYLTDNLDLNRTSAAAERQLSYVSRFKPSEESVKNLARLILINSTVGGNGADFEYTITDFFNLFNDVSATRLGGAGNTDVLSTFKKTIIFNADGKSMSGGITSSIHAQRLNRHIAKHNAEYCWVVGPGFSPGALQDIEGHKIVTVRADTLAIFLRTWLSLGIDDLSYSQLHGIVNSNFGRSVDYSIRNLIKEMSSKSVA